VERDCMSGVGDHEMVNEHRLTDLAKVDDGRR
jgi:hypothetical protein